MRSAPRRSRTSGPGSSGSWARPSRPGWALLDLAALQTVAHRDHLRGEVRRHAVIALALPLARGVAVVGGLEEGHVPLERHLAIALGRIPVAGPRVRRERL